MAERFDTGVPLVAYEVALGPTARACSGSSGRAAGETRYDTEPQTS